MNLKKQQNRLSVMQLNYKNTKAVIRGRNEIGNQFEKYYQELYEAAQNAVHKKNLINFVQKLNLPKVTEEQNITLTKPRRKFIIILKNLNYISHLGVMDIQMSFFKEFQLELVPLLCKTYNWAVDKETWAVTWISAIVTVLHKG